MGKFLLVANTLLLLRDKKHGPEVISALSDVQLGASTMARRVSSLSENLTEQVDRDLAACRWFSIQCDESVDSASTAQLMIFIQMVFDDFSTKEELLTLLPLKATTRGVDIYTAVKNFFVEKKVPLNKLASITTDGAPAMTGRHAGFIAQRRNDPDFPTFLHYHCIIHQQAICAKVTGFDHVMTPVVRIINSIRSCDGVANCLVLPPTPHKRASRPAPDLFYFAKQNNNGGVSPKRFFE